MLVETRPLAKPPSLPDRTARLLGAIGEAFVTSNGPVHDWCEDDEFFFVLQGAEVVRYEKRSRLLTGRADLKVQPEASGLFYPVPTIHAHPSWGDTFVVAAGPAYYAWSKKTLQIKGVKTGPLCTSAMQVGPALFVPIQSNSCDPDLLDGANRSVTNFVLTFDPRPFDFGRAFPLGLEAAGYTGAVEPVFRAPSVAVCSDGAYFWVVGFDAESLLSREGAKSPKRAKSTTSPKAAPLPPSSADFVKAFDKDGRLVGEAHGALARFARDSDFAPQWVEVVPDREGRAVVKFFSRGQEKYLEVRLERPGSPVRKAAPAKKPASPKKKPASPAKKRQVVVQVGAPAGGELIRDFRVARVPPRRVIRPIL